MSASSLDGLLSVINTLLGPDGCDWDKAQTPESLCDYVVEEAFELVEAIRSADTREAMEELGDVAFLLLFIASLYEKKNEFTLADALDNSAAKMVRRHPHVFGDEAVADTEEILKNWESIKRSETADGSRKSVFGSLPKGLPPLIRAYRINSKSARNGFTWEDTAQVEEQLRSEWNEWQTAREYGNHEDMLDEFGDYLFTLTEYGRRHSIKANEALDFANRKFLLRYERMERIAQARGLNLDDLSMPEKDALWAEAKIELNKA